MSNNAYGLHIGTSTSLTRSIMVRGPSTFDYPCCKYIPSTLTAWLPQLSYYRVVARKTCTIFVTRCMLISFLAITFAIWIQMIQNL